MQILKEKIVRYETDGSIVKGYDAGELIRCKDCKYYANSSEECWLINTRLHFYVADKRWTENSFCSWAERKD